MITQLTIDGFKCFTATTLDLAPLTVLSGVNGAGKSSLIQAIVLAEASHELPKHVPLNGLSGLLLGQAGNVLPRGRMRLEMKDEQQRSCEWILAFDDVEDPYLTVVQSPTGERSNIQNLIYLCAERIGPRRVYDAEPYPRFPGQVGYAGQYAAYMLADHDTDPVIEARLFPGADVGVTLLKQLEAWLAFLFPGTEVRAQKLATIGAAVVEIKTGSVTTDWRSAPNVGFGITYVFPIVVAGLLAQTGSLLVVENPEAHLHPSAQSRIARFLATIATSGTQVILETHSDHVLNGLRLAVVDEHPLTPGDVIIHHFEQPGRATNIRISSRGNFSSTPAAFFDQTERDLAALLRSRPNN